MKVNLFDTTFVIPLRIDSIIRLENCLSAVDYIQNYFNTNIFILEADNFNNSLLKKLLNKEVRYLFLRDNDPVFYKTKLLNFITSQIKTPYIGIWDADVVAYRDSILSSIISLRDNKADISYPYDGTFLDTSLIIRNLFIDKDLDINVLTRNKTKMRIMYPGPQYGGAVFLKKDSYFKAGRENENFYGWGMEDAERHYRMINLGLRLHRSANCLYHLSHPRDHNGKMRSRLQESRVHGEFFNLLEYSESELREIVNKKKL